MAQNFVFTMASGQVGDELKFYFHCQYTDSGYAMAEVIFKIGFRSVSATIKTTRQDLVYETKEKLESVLSAFTVS